MNKKIAGKLGEFIASNYLKDRGCKILYNNWTCRWGEIDLIAEKDGTLIFVEVKYRNGGVNGHPSESINYFKKKSLQRSINIFLSSNCVTTPWRVDVLCVSKLGKSVRVDYYEYVSL
jgi:putative endonuclease